MTAQDLLGLLKELNRIAYLLDTLEWGETVSIETWYERRDTIREELEGMGFMLSSIDPVELGATTYSNLSVLYTDEMREGFPEQWEKRAKNS